MTSQMYFYFVYISIVLHTFTQVKLEYSTEYCQCRISTFVFVRCVPWSPQTAGGCTPASTELGPVKPAAPSLLPYRSAPPPPSTPRLLWSDPGPVCTVPDPGTLPAGLCCSDTGPRRSWSRCSRGFSAPGRPGLCLRTGTPVSLCRCTETKRCWTCSSPLGPTPPVHPLWSFLSSRWGHKERRSETPRRRPPRPARQRLQSGWKCPKFWWFCSWNSPQTSATSFGKASQIWASSLSASPPSMSASPPWLCSASPWLGLYCVVAPLSRWRRCVTSARTAEGKARRHDTIAKPGGTTAHDSEPSSSMSARTDAFRSSRTPLLVLHPAPAEPLRRAAAALSSLPSLQLCLEEAADCVTAPSHR